MAAAVLAVLACGTTGRADNYVVNSSADEVDASPGAGGCATAGGACTLRAAVQEANAHAGPDVITLPAGVFVLSLVGAGENAAATGDLDVAEELEVDGAGMGATVIDGLYSDRIFHCAAGLTLHDMTLQHGNASDYGGAVYISAAAPLNITAVEFDGNLAIQTGGALAVAATALTVSDSVFHANRVVAGGTTNGGGAIRVAAATMTVSNSEFVANNTVGGVGGAINSQSPGAVSITGSTFSYNSASPDGSLNGGVGGAVYLDIAPGTVSISGSTFTGNSAATIGALIAENSPSISLMGSTFDANHAVGQIGGFILTSASGAIVATDNMATGNFATGGIGGGLVSGATVQVSGGEFSDNVGFGVAGGLLASSTGSISVSGTAFRRNDAGTGPGGGLFVSSAGDAALTNVEASENSALQGSGIFAVATNSLSVTGGRIVNNGGSAGIGGGLFASGATGTITDTTIDGNVMNGPGGGLFANFSNTLTMSGTTVSNNHAAGLGGLGGGAYVAVANPSTFTNSTFSGNVADAQGGALLVGGNLTARNLTIADNTSPMGSAVLNGGVFTPISTIIAGSAGSHCAGSAVTSGGNNIDSNGTCVLAGPNDHVADPQLGPLADNGGPTLTHLPAASSPAIDGGAAAGCPATDQRGQTRPTDGNGDASAVCDVGAVEFLDFCLDDPAKTEPGICGCGVPDSDVNQANGTADCLINGELKARVARAKAIIAALAGDQDPLEAELGTIGGSLSQYLKDFSGQLVVTGNAKKAAKMAKKAAKAIKKVGKAKAGPKLDKAKGKANTALDAFDAMIAPQA